MKKGKRLTCMWRRRALFMCAASRPVYFASHVHFVQRVLLCERRIRGKRDWEEEVGEKMWETERKRERKRGGGGGEREKSDTSCVNVWSRTEVSYFTRARESVLWDSPFWIVDRCTGGDSWPPTRIEYAARNACHALAIPSSFPHFCRARQVDNKINK